MPECMNQPLTDQTVIVAWDFQPWKKQSRYLETLHLSPLNFIDEYISEE